MMIPAYTARARVGNVESAAVGKYSFAWRTHTSPATAALPTRGKPSPARYVRVAPKAPELWIAGSLRIVAPPSTGSLRGPLNMHTVAGYPGWGAGVSSYAIDVYGDHFTFSFNGGGRWLVPIRHAVEYAADPLGTANKYAVDDNFTGASTTEFAVPFVVGQRYDIVTRILYDAAAGAFDAWVDGQPVVSRAGFPTAWPSDPAYAGGEQWVQGWEGIYEARPPEQQVDAAIWHTAFRFGTDLPSCLADRPAPADYWHSTAQAAGGADSGSDVDPVGFDVATFVAPGQPTPAPPPVPPVPVPPPPPSPLDARVAALEADRAAVLAAAKAMGGTATSFAGRIRKALGG